MLIVYRDLYRTYLSFSAVLPSPLFPMDLTWIRALVGIQVVFWLASIRPLESMTLQAGDQKALKISTLTKQEHIKHFGSSDINTSQV